LDGREATSNRPRLVRSAKKDLGSALYGYYGYSSHPRREYSSHDTHHPFDLADPERPATPASRTHG